MNLLDILNAKPVSACTGKIFKAEVSHFKTTRGFGFSVKLVKSKARSCPGCDSCAWQDDAFDNVDNYWPIIGIQQAEHGKLYKLTSCNENRDYETGMIDSWDLCLSPIND